MYYHISMKFLLIGNGFIALRHKEAIRDIGGEITEVFGLEKGENYWKEAIKNTNADCVVFLTPNDLHFEMAKMAAEQGKIVLCEKPLVIKSEQVEILAKYPDIFTVLQLRHHPLVKEIKSGIKKDENYELEIDISIHRDENYYQSWKGQKEKSGGILFNLGIHYFDLLLYLFGEPKEVLTFSLNDKTARGLVKGENYICNWQLSTDEIRKNQRRVFKINKENYNFSSKDNLSYENLHKFVYQDLLKRKGILPKEVLKSIKLVESIYKSS